MFKVYRTTTSKSRFGFLIGTVCFTVALQFFTVDKPDKLGPNAKCRRARNFQGKGSAAAQRWKWMGL